MGSGRKSNYVEVNVELNDVSGRMRGQRDEGIVTKRAMANVSRHVPPARSAYAVITPPLRL